MKGILSQSDMFLNSEQIFLQPSQMKETHSLWLHLILCMVHCLARNYNEEGFFVLRPMFIILDTELKVC